MKRGRRGSILAKALPYNKKATYSGEKIISLTSTALNYLF